MFKDSLVQDENFIPTKILKALTLWSLHEYVIESQRRYLVDEYIFRYSAIERLLYICNFNNYIIILNKFYLHQLLNMYTNEIYSYRKNIFVSETILFHP